MIEILLPDLDAAIEEARDLYRKTFVKAKEKQVTIVIEEGMLWKYHKGKTQKFTF